MGDCSWKKIVLARSDNKWITTIKEEKPEEEAPNTTKFCLDEDESSFRRPKTEQNVSQEDECEESFQVSGEPVSMMQEIDPLEFKSTTRKRQPRKMFAVKGESTTERESRLAKMSAYAARRLANELPEQREARLRRMSEYAARRLATETPEQRANRLSRMSAYAARRLANETPEQRQTRLMRMSAYAARKRDASQAMKSDSSFEAGHRTRNRSSRVTLMPNQS